MRFLMITCTLLFIGVTGSYSQNRKTVAYDFAKKELTGAIPFDQPFNIKCVNIPDDVKDLHVVIYDVNRINYSGKWNKKEPLTDEALQMNKKACTFFYQTDKQERHSDTLNIPVLVFLRPNASYLVEIAGNTYTELSDEENDAAVQAIMDDDGFIAANNQVIVTQLLTPAGSKSWSQNMAAIHTAAEAAAKKVNEKYTLSGDNYDEQFTRFLNATNALNQIRAELRHHKEGFYGEAYDLLNSSPGKKPKLVTDKEGEIDALQQKIDGLKETAKTDNSAALAQQIATAGTQMESLRKELALIQGSLTESKRQIAGKGVLDKDLSIGKISSSVEKKMKQTDWFNATKSDLDFTTEFKNDLNKEKIKGLSSTEIATIADDMAGKFQAKIDKPLDELLEARDELKKNIAVELGESLFSYKETGNTYPTSLEERFKMHVTLDLGYAYVGRVDRFNLYAGMNFYFRAIDTSLPLSNYRGKFTDVIGSRASLLLGVSLTSIKKDGIRRGIISEDMALISGVGFRLLSFFKVNGGAYFFYQYPTDPLANKSNYHVKAAPFVSFSLDFNIQSFLESFGNGHVANIFKP
ncbi:hypothetical protein WJU16_22890 [Chitinophaga pollutisoli]|uniref:Uncharacterized protein n=1 Tax=Chitinophaga pollutisoli TaxID=3133966 RepID=A0ABZ2YN48_9BACT